MLLYHKMCNFTIISSIVFIILTFLISKEAHCQFHGSNYNISTTTCTSFIANLNQRYENRVDRNSAIVFTFPVDSSYFVDPSKTNLRIEVETDSVTTLSCPVLFAMRQQQFITTFQVPHTFDHRPSPRSMSYNTAARTLCFQDDRNLNAEGRNISVRVSTCSKTKKNFSLKLVADRNFLLDIDKQIEIDVSPTHPVYYGFKFPNGVLLVRLRAISTNSHCMTMSIQSPHCPIFDQENNVRYEGLWQTMSTTAAVTIEKTKRFEDGFIVVLVVNSDDVQCQKPSTPMLTEPNNKSRFSNSIRESYRYKSISLLISNESKVPRGYLFLSLFIPVAISILIVIIVTLLFHNRHQWISKEAANKIDKTSSLRHINSSKHDIPEEAQILNETANEHDTQLQTVEEFITDDVDNISANNTVQNHHADNNDIETLSPIQEFYIKQQGGKIKKSGLRFISDIHISDFTLREHSIVQKSSKRFYWTITIVAIFYSIPVYQLIIQYLRVLYRTGEYDICYYNYLCANRLGIFIDFNHFWSNISYIIFGFSFIFLVSRRASNLKMTKQKNSIETNGIDDNNCCCCCTSSCIPERIKNCECICGFSKIYGQWNLGIPTQFGVFYALGIALAMEGVLSAAYHLCPNSSSFQFDTCFMYVIAVLIILKICQFRHPAHLGANHTFAILAGFVIVSVVGLLFEFQDSQAKIIYRWIFILLQYVTMTFISIYYYCVGYIKDGTGQLITDWKIFLHLNQMSHQKFDGNRLVLPFLSTLVSLAVLIYAELGHENFATYLLYLLIGNVLAYTIYYVGIMKPLHREFKNKTWIQPTLYFVSAVIIGGVAVNYFVRSPAEWELSASASREGNEECMNSWFPFFPYYDSHDVWHFLSAAALFLAFMGLLTVDDDLFTTSQSKIPIF